jgi:ribosomal protein S18 acetylase RimI-like enzyme
MKLIEYDNLTTLLQDIFPVIDNNFISHYLLFELTDRVINGGENVFYGCTVKNENTTEIIYLHTERGHYFFGMTNDKSAIKLLSNIFIKRQFTIDAILFGSVFIIDNISTEKNLNLKKTRHRYYMSLKAFTLNENNNNNNLFTATEKDFNLLAPLRIGFYREEFEGEGLQTDVKILSDFKQNLNSGDIFYWKQNNRVTTLISLTRLPEDRIYIPFIYTLPAYRAKGISKLALSVLLNNLFNSGIIEIGLNVKVSNTNALNLFSSLGMAKIYETGIYELD